MSERLKDLPTQVDNWGRPVAGDFGPFKRPLSESEWEFINNERLMCKFDFKHYFTNYCSTLIITDAYDSRHNTVAKIGSLLASQELLFRKIAEREDKVYEAMAKRLPIDGIQIIMNKARQLGATVLWRGLSWHRLIFWDDTNAMTASIGKEEVQSLYDKDKIIFNNMPWWLKPQVLYDTKMEQIKFAGINTNINYFQANQHGGMGTGFTIQVVHLTELGLWEKMASPESVDKIRLDLIPAIPQSPRTLVGFESTPYGRGNYWHKLVMNSWEGRTAFDVFYCPFYAEPRKYRKAVPEGWIPNETTAGMMARVEATSPVYMFGKTVRLEPEQSYWWEFHYKTARDEGNLADFLSNYSSTLEESFQHSGAKAFGVEQMIWVHDQTRAGVPYEIRGGRAI